MKPAEITPQVWGRITQILPSLPARDRLLVRLLADCGLRRDEASALDAGDLALDANPRTLKVRCGKGGKARTIPIPPVLWAELRVFLGLRRTGPVFPSRKGDAGITGGQINRIVRHVGILAGVPKLHAHALRHYCASRLVYANGGDVRAAQQVLGHEDPRTTEKHYVDVWMFTLAEQVARAAAWMPPQPESGGCHAKGGQNQATR